MSDTGKNEPHYLVFLVFAIIVTDVRLLGCDGTTFSQDPGAFACLI